MTQSARFRDVATIWRKATPSDPEYVAPDAQYGTEGGGWTPLDGYEVGSPPVTKKVFGERMDTPPSRDEALRMGQVVGRNQTRWRMRWRGDLDSSMEVTIHRDQDERYKIIGGPAEYGGPKQQIELLLEKYT